MSCLFKAGDLVRCEEDDGWETILKKNKIYTVKEIYISGGDSFIVLDLPGIDGCLPSSPCFLFGRFKLVSEISVKKNKRLLK